MPPKPRLRQNPTQNAASTPTSAKSISKCRDKPDMGRTDLKMPLKPRLGGENELRMPCQARIRKNRSQKCRGVKSAFGKTALKRPPHEARLRQNRTHDAAQTTPTAIPTAKCRRHPDFGKTELKRPPHQFRLGQNQAQNAAASNPTLAKPISKMPRRQAQLGKTGIKMSPQPRQLAKTKRAPSQTPAKPN